MRGTRLDTFETISYEKAQGIGWMTLNRPLPHRALKCAEWWEPGGSLAGGRLFGAWGWL